MGACTICGKPAGIFRSVHKECAKARADALAKLPIVITGYLGLSDQQSNVDGLTKVFNQIADLSQLDVEESEQQIKAGLQTAVIASMSDGNLSDQEYRRVMEIGAALGANLDDLDESTKDLLVKGLILRDLRNGVIQSRVPLADQLPIALKKGEQLLWFSAPVTRMETKTRTRYVGGSHGFSFRIMKGVSYRVGGHAGERIQTTSLVPAGVGGLAYTNEAVYFLGSGNNLRMPVKTIATVDRYSDGICVTPNRGKSQIFLLAEQQFAADLIKAIRSLN